MAAAALSAPGSEYGPCLHECAHTDCAANRKMAAQECVTCLEPIGYNQRFYNVTPDGAPAWSQLQHLICAVKEREAEDRLESWND